MDFNNTNYYEYKVKAYENGFQTYHVEDGVDVWDMCFNNEDAAISYAMSLNMREARRVADAIARLEKARKNLVFHDTPYYSITGYYGD